MNPKVTVYIPNHNYAHFLDVAIKSVISQIFTDWELFIILDGVIDNSKKISCKYSSIMPDKIKVVENKERKGLQYCANKILAKARGEYFIRLDSDDYFNESALLVMSEIMDKDPDISLVYSDYFYVDEHNIILDIDNRKKIGKEVNILDLPAHGACSLCRVSVLKSIGGYSEDFVAQDGHDLWYMIKDKYKITNVSTPLFYYRQHPQSLSKDNHKILNERKKIKRKYVGTKYKKYKIAFVIGAKNTYVEFPNIVFKKFKSKPLIDHTVEIVKKLDFNGKSFISTDDGEVVKYCNKFTEFQVIDRPKSLSGISKTIEDVIFHAVTYMEKELLFYPDIIVFLNVNSPLKNTSHILKAIDTLIIHNCESVISVYEDFDLHFQHRRYGLEAISKRRHRKLRLEREALYVDNRAINVCWRSVVKETDSRGKSIGHIIMARDESINIKSQLDFDYAEMISENMKG